jgi:hypothetical protein
VSKIVKIANSDEPLPIFVCDEMRVNVAATLIDLEVAGYVVAYYTNASDGWSYLEEAIETATVPALLVVDMALLPGANEHAFPDDEIDEGQTTGILLIQKTLALMRRRRGEDFANQMRSKTILYTRVSEEYYVRKAHEFAENEKISFMKKRINDDGEFVNSLLRLLS